MEELRICFRSMEEVGSMFSADSQYNDGKIKGIWHNNLLVGVRNDVGRSIRILFHSYPKTNKKLGRTWT
jgi:hypothetical protein